MLSKRFEKSDQLFAHVYTNLEDLYTLEEEDQLFGPATCETLRTDKHPSALYSRTIASETFYFGTNERGTRWKTVVLRSKR